MKIVVLKKKNGEYKIPRFIRFKIRKNVTFKFEYNGELYDKSLELKEKEVRQVSLLVEALNIKNKKSRLAFVYDKSCDLLDEDFYGKNVCEFIDGKCLHDRYYGGKGGGCCCRSDHSYMCEHLTESGCSIRCLPCKFHVCDLVRKKGLKYHFNDIYLIKYLFNWKQKLMLFTDFFMTKEECLKNIYRNSIILWCFSRNKKFVKYNLNDK